MFLQSFYHPSKSLADRQYTAEFDDALVDQIAWKNARYDGCKIISKEINKYTPLQTASNSQTGVGFAVITNVGPGIGNMVLGGTGLTQFTVGGYYAQSNTIGTQPTLNQPGIFKLNNFIPNITWQGDSLNPSGLNPNIKKETTAIYISNTVIGGDEDEQFATIKNHSYINIHQILLIDPLTDATQLIDKQVEDFTPFHSFITNNLPTQGSFSIKIIDESIANNLKGANQYKVKMNKGFLLKTFDFKMDLGSEQLTENNSIYLYKGGTNKYNFYSSSGVIKVPSPPSISNGDRIRFKYGIIEMIAGGIPTKGHSFEKSRIGPSFGSASIIENKFTQQYYSGSYGLINEPSQPQGTLNSHILSTSGLGSASRFIGINTVGFLTNNNINENLSQEEKTELHITFFEGTKDFSRGSNDERSISTFEIDRNQEQLDVGGLCNDFLPKTHEIILKGLNDDRFAPKTNTYEDSFISAYLTSSNQAGGCVTQGTQTPAISFSNIQLGTNADETQDALVYVQGGIIGQDGYISYQTSSNTSLYGRSNITHGSGPLNSSTTVNDNLYSGSFSYQLSFLDKSHTIITNLNKAAELFDGIGTKGIIIIPENTHPKIKNNIKFYLQQAGILPTSPNTQVQLTQDS